ncbi:MAG TPA: hypothetical protein VFV41_17430 [Streptosporangiaceae bacterium]|nr:hypothetical protein [Streptosporangiaceae bacterium]
MLTTLARKAGLDRNPLRRPVDRAERLLLAGLVVIGLTATPVLAMTAAQLSYDAGLRQLAAERSWHQVTATLLQDADTGSSSSGWDASSVPARWAAPVGRWHQGQVGASPVARAGQRVLIWVDAAGHQTRAPIQRPSVQQNASGLAVFVGCGSALALFMIGEVVHLVADRRRMAGWERDWRTTARRWATPR